MAVLAGSFFAYGKKPNNETENATETVKLGIMMPLTSDYGALAEGYRNASLLAVKDWNAAHPNVSVEAVVEDDSFNATKGMSAYKKMKDIDKVDGIVSISTPVLDALHETYLRDGLPVVNLGVQTQGVGDDNVFQMLPDAKGQVLPLAEYMEKETDYTSVVVVHTTPDASYNEFYVEFSKLYKGPMTDVILNTEADSPVLASKILASKPQAVIFIIGPGLGASITKELKKQGSDDIAFYYEGSLISGFDEYKKVLGDTNILNGATSIKTVASDLSEFTLKYQAEYGVAPTMFAEVGYDSTMILLNSFDENKETWVENIANTSYEGLSGKVTYDENGIRVPKYEVVHVINGAIQ